MNPLFRILHQAFFISTSFFLSVSLSLSLASHSFQSFFLLSCLSFFPLSTSSSRPPSLCPFLPPFLPPISFFFFFLLVSYVSHFCPTYIFLYSSVSFSASPPPLLIIFLPENQTLLSLPASNTVVLFYTDLF